MKDERNTRKNLSRRQRDETKVGLIQTISRYGKVPSHKEVPKELKDIVNYFNRKSES